MLELGALSHSQSDMYYHSNHSIHSHSALLVVARDVPLSAGSTVGTAVTRGFGASPHRSFPFVAVPHGDPGRLTTSCLLTTAILAIAAAAAAAAGFPCKTAVTQREVPTSAPPV